MAEFVISDTHFGHNNIIKYCDRPFMSVTEMNEALIRLWNEVVNKEDTVYHLGDVVFKQIEPIEKILARLNGKKILILGNHDDESPIKWLRRGFSEAHPLPLEFKNVILSHRPIVIGSVNKPVWYGHVHNIRMLDQEEAGNKCFSVEQIDYRPVKLDQLLGEPLGYITNPQYAEDPM